NLMSYLLKFPISEYFLVDPDILKVENVFRHSFGFNYLSNYKTDILKNQILSKNPFSIVKTDNRDICKVLDNDEKALEHFNIRILVVGLSRIEIFILEHLIKIKSDKPVLILWVEPYMASGQLLFIQPKHFAKAIDLIKN